MNIDLENFIESRYRHLLNTHPELFNSEYSFLYQAFSDSILIDYLSAIHSGIVASFEQMNKILPTGLGTGYFHADDSRLLIDLISEIKATEEGLSGSEVEFSVDEYFKKILDYCDSWLKYYHGSSIPPETEKVIVYYKKPLFIKATDALPFQTPLSLSETDELIGKGGFGEVYRHTHPLIDVDFAIKVFHPMFQSKESEEDKRRFLREAKMLFTLHHDNIVQIYDVGKIDGNLFIKEQYIDGVTLIEFREKHGNLNFLSAGRATIQILKGLEHAHSKGIVHRDLKPSNVMVENIDNRYKCTIIDFGISAFMDSEAYTQLTKTGEHIAGGAFIDPILTQDTKLRDARSDIYSAGAILYYLLCGRAPFGSDIGSYLKQANPSLSDKQIKVVLKALEADIASRYGSCREMMDSINDAFDM